MLYSKIHRATVTHADVNYEGSVTLPPHLLEAAGLAPYQAVAVWNVTTGSRFETYAILGRAGGDIAINGAAAHLAGPGDVIIVSAFIYVPENGVVLHRPRMVFVDGNNRITEIRPELPGPQSASSASASNGHLHAGTKAAEPAE